MAWYELKSTQSCPFHATIDGYRPVENDQKHIYLFLLCLLLLLKHHKWPKNCMLVRVSFFGRTLIEIGGWKQWNQIYWLNENVQFPQPVSEPVVYVLLHNSNSDLFSWILFIHSFINIHIHRSPSPSLFYGVPFRTYFFYLCILL